MYKRSEDGIVLVDQDKCRGWRMCVTGCPYKKVYFNHRTGKAEKCTFCYPRIEVGLPTVCSETCVGRLRYLGLVLYDADRVLAAASVENETDLYEAQLDLLLDPTDPAVIAGARASGISDEWLDAARRSPVYALAKTYRIALPLHPEYRTMPMVWYVPPLSPVVDAISRDGHDGEDADNLFGAISALRIPIEYLAGLFTAGDTAVGRRGAAQAGGHAVVHAGHQPRPRTAAGDPGVGRHEPGADVRDVPAARDREIRGPVCDPDRLRRGGAPAGGDRHGMLAELRGRARACTRVRSVRRGQRSARSGCGGDVPGAQAAADLRDVGVGAGRRVPGEPAELGRQGLARRHVHPAARFTPVGRHRGASNEAARAAELRAADRRVVWQAASLLLAYPDDGQDDRLDLVERGVAALPEPQRAPLLGMRASTCALSPVITAAAAYSETFDWRRRRTLFLTYYTAGDTRNRGMALLMFANVYRAAGVEPPTGELPDHLAVLLEFAATVDETAGFDLLCQHRTPIGMLHQALRNASRRYAAVIEAVCGDPAAGHRSGPARGPPAGHAGTTHRIGRAGAVRADDSASERRSAGRDPQESAR